MKRTFCIQVIMSAYTDFMFVSGKEFVEILAHLANSTPMEIGGLPNSLLLIQRNCRPSLERQLPFLKEIDTSTLNEQNADDWIGDVAREYRTWHDLEPMNENL